MPISEPEAKALIKAMILIAKAAATDATSEPSHESLPYLYYAEDEALALLTTNTEKE